jgi:hypothetical protein
MADSEEPAALAYIEKTFADSYRKEIDQETVDELDREDNG